MYSSDTQDGLLNCVTKEGTLVTLQAIAEMTFDQMVSAGVSFDTAARLIVGMQWLQHETCCDSHHS